MNKRTILIACAIFAAVVAVGGLIYLITRPTPPSNEFQVRSVVNGLGDVIGQVTLATTTAGVATLMDEHYALYIHPNLLADWKAHPEKALLKETLTGKPDRINIETVTQNADGTYSIDGVVTTVWNAHASSTMPGNVPVRFVLTQGPDGWQITSYEPR